MQPRTPSNLSQPQVGSESQRVGFLYQALVSRFFVEKERHTSLSSSLPELLRDRSSTSRSISRAHHQHPLLKMSDNEKATTEHVPPSGPVEDHMGDEPPHHGMSAGQYITSRFSSLKPPMSKLPNPFSLIMMLNGHHWAFFMVAFFAWV